MYKVFYTLYVSSILKKCHSILYLDTLRPKKKNYPTLFYKKITSVSLNFFTIHQESGRAKNDKLFQQFIVSALSCKYLKKIFSFRQLTTILYHIYHIHLLKTTDLNIYKNLQFEIIILIKNENGALRLRPCPTYSFFSWLRYSITRYDAQMKDPSPYFSCFRTFV
ncbi:hypothetical protein QTP88_019488 [Uroleucon formosanum]